MSEPFIGEIRMWSFDWPPRNWARCDGALIAVNQNPSLYSLLGTTYGGDGQTTFKLPDLRGRVPIHRGYNYYQGLSSGVETVYLSEDNLPAHTHDFNASSDVANSSSNPGDNFLATSNKESGNPNMYASEAELTQMKSDTVSFVGGGHPHNNMQPYQVVNFCIALQGLFPSRN